MPDNVMDYQAMLADMEAKKAALEQAIAHLRAAIVAGALGQTVDTSITPATGSLTLTGASPGSIPHGAFLGKSIVESIILYLATVRKRSLPSEIVKGLKKGGITSTSKHFPIVVRNTMGRLKNEGKLLVFDDGWGLPEWVHEGLRSRVEQQTKVQPKKRGAKKKTRKAKTKAEKPAKSTKDSESPRPKELIEKYFSSHAGTEVSAKELAQKLNIKRRGLILVMSQMARKGLLEKTASGKFRASSKVTPISKAG